MTTFTKGDAANYAGAVLLQDAMVQLRSQISGNKWEDRHNMPQGGDVAANTPWSAGYNSVWGDGPPYPEHLYISALNQEIAAFPTGDAIRDLGSVPFTLDGSGNIVIKPRQLNSQEKAAFSRAGNSATSSVYARLKLMSGAACTYPYGLVPPYGFKMTAKVTTKQGTWPAFWGVPTDGSWPPELDTVEVLNANGNNKQNTTSIHTKDSSWPNKARALQPPPTYVGSDTATQNLAVPGDLDTAFHEWMSIVYSDFTATLFDNKIVMIWPTPSDFNKRMNLMVNLAVGGQGDWAGTPPNPNGDLGQMVIQKLEVWRFPPTYGQGSQPIPPDPGPDPQPPTVDIPAALASLNQAKASVNNAQGQLTNAAAQIDSAIKTLGG